MHDLWTLVDHADTEVGCISAHELQSFVVGNVNRYLRTSCVFLRNPQGQLWTPRRVGDTFIAPNGLDFAAAKHVSLRESYLNAAIRGLKQEQNLPLPHTSLALVGQLGPMQQLGLSYFSMIYMYDNDGKEPSFNCEHFVSGEWLMPQQIINRIEAGVPAKSLLVPAIKLLMIKEGLL